MDLNLGFLVDMALRLQRYNTDMAYSVNNFNGAKGLVLIEKINRFKGQTGKKIV